MRVISAAATSCVLKMPQAADETADGCGDEFRVYQSGVLEQVQLLGFK